MDSSEKIQPVKGGSGGAAVPTAFAGTVTAVKQENGGQSVEIRFSQGRIKLQAEGEFLPGERVKLTFAGNGSVQVEKGPVPDAQGEPGGVGYRLPANMSMLKDLRAFEENVSRFLAEKRAAGPGTGVPGGAGAGQAMGHSMGNTSLPQLLMQAMDRQGGRDMLAEHLPSLHRGMVSALADALQETDGDPGSKTGLLGLLKALDRSRNGAGAELGGRTATPAVANTGSFMTGEVGTGHAPWFGRVAEKTQADGFLTPMQRLQFGGAGTTVPGATPSIPFKSEPLFRYQMDMGGRMLEVFSPQPMETGAFVDFELERQGGRVQARFSDPAASLPRGVRAAMAGASPELRQGMLVASHYLQDFKGEPYYRRLVKDFGEVLAQSGAMDAKNAEGRPGIPDRKDLDGLLKLFVAYPRDAEQPERQAKVWGDALKDPLAMMRLLKAMRPEQDASLLRAATGLRLAPGEEERTPAGFPLGAMGPEAAEGGAEGPEAAAAWLKKMLPEAFSSGDLLRLAADGSPLTAAGKEHEAAKFLLQAVANGFPREDQMPEGKPGQFYFYQGQEWRNLQVTWKRDGGGEGRGKAGPKAPLQVRVETTAKHMGQVNVAVSWEPKGAKMDFRNQFHDVRDLLKKFLPELEKSLTLLNFKVTSWNYELLPPEASASQLPDPGWARPAGPSDGANLDLLG